MSFMANIRRMMLARKQAVGPTVKAPPSQGFTVRTPHTLKISSPMKMAPNYQPAMFTCSAMPAHTSAVPDFELPPWATKMLSDEEWLKQNRKQRQRIAIARMTNSPLSTEDAKFEAEWHERHLKVLQKSVISDGV